MLDIWVSTKHLISRKLRKFYFYLDIPLPGWNGCSNGRRSKLEIELITSVTSIGINCKSKIWKINSTFIIVIVVNVTIRLILSTFQKPHITQDDYRDIPNWFHKLLEELHQGCPWLWRCPFGRWWQSCRRCPWPGRWHRSTVCLNWLSRYSDPQSRRNWNPFESENCKIDTFFYFYISR